MVHHSPASAGFSRYATLLGLSRSWKTSRRTPAETAHWFRYPPMGPFAALPGCGQAPARSACGSWVAKVPARSRAPVPAGIISSDGIRWSFEVILWFCVRRLAISPGNCSPRAYSKPSVLSLGYSFRPLSQVFVLEQ